MTPAERKATEAVVRAAKRWSAAVRLVDVAMGQYKLFEAVARLLREEAKTKTKEKRRGK